ncbi:MAG: type II toxin-antitoxin system Phd/YefM family antitoxin [Deltaproteobacteria bacterium]|jgi:prevent-host-death family protein|nr:type II toxin-antitoxin system Phd/YefM family antitoxin [Deltaproteobacteria bacterium]MBT4526189.1 type II toxin-antitoxin system Phd/YefM family antitoxin [Deltaproteobacteria bacterium]
MITVKENTTLVGVSELRSGIDEVLKKAQEGLVIIEKRHKPQAVLISHEEYAYMQNIMEIAEDFVLGHIAKERLENSDDSDYVDLESLLK